MSGLLRRLSRVSVGELRCRLAERTRVAAEAAVYSVGRARWRREQLKSRLVGSRDLALANEALRSRNWPNAEAALRRHFSTRAPRFVLDPAHRQAVVSAILEQYPTASEDARCRADRLLAGRHDLLGYRDLTFHGAEHDVDWHADPVHGRRAPESFWARVPYLNPGGGDHKVIWELNRHQHWLALGRAAWLTGDRRYAGAFAVELESWLTANPPLTGINWASMLELGLRSISWIWALHFFAASEDDPETPWLVDLLVALDRQLDHVAGHLSTYFSPNTHLLGEGLALYVGGRVVPELRSAARWARVGREILIREAARQVLPDGGHAELSPHYHRYALDFYLLALAVARQTGDEAGGRFAEVASKLATWCRSVADDRGQLPTIGDDDGGVLLPMCGRTPADASDSLSLAASLLARPDLAVGEPPEEVLWMRGGDRAALLRPTGASTRSSRVFADSGYAVLRGGGAHAVMDVGRHGFLNGGHAHADALSLVLTVGDRPLLIDPGTATYTMNPAVRDRFRSTAMHNTATIDGRSQSEPASAFHWRTSTDARLDGWRSVGSVDFVEGHHAGYRPCVHRRAVMRGPGGLWLVADHILGPGSHRADLHWHLHPAWSLDGAPGQTVRLTHRDGGHAAIASTAEGPASFLGDPEGLGWCAPVYGQLIPSLTLRWSLTAELPVSAVTAIGSSVSPVELLIDPSPVTVGNPDDWHRVAAVGAHDGGRFVALFATPRGLQAGARAVQRVAAWRGDFATDARAALLRLSRHLEPVSLVLIDATLASWQGPGFFNVQIGPRASAGDLHLDRTTLERLSREGARTAVGRGR